MKALAVLINRGNYYLRYFIQAAELAGVEVITLGDYLDKDQSGYDTLIYNTFPDEDCRKFDRTLTAKCDEKFRSFTGKKILLDNHDNGTKDGFARFNDYATPRIKANPSYKLMERINVVMTIPFKTFWIYEQPHEVREGIVCALRTQICHRIDMPLVRRQALSRIEQFNPDNRRLPLMQHAARLCRALINVVPTGTGDSSRSHTDTLAAGALLMCEENIKDIKILPHIDLVENEHFVTFTLDNIADKLETLLNNRAELDRIRLNGLAAFRQGYSFAKSAEQLKNL